MSIQHVVLVGFEPELDAGTAAEMRAQVHAWPEAIGGFETLRFGPPLGTERTCGYHYCIVMEVADEAALERYQLHPVHQRFARWVRDHGGTVLAFDYVLDGATELVGRHGPA